jgi:glycosyltransferase involved in cell wall biosynthesis
MDKHYKNAKIKAILRNFLSFIYYNLVYQYMRSKYEQTRGCNPLKPGISAVVAAKDEGVLIKYCLESLIGFADQIICIDNGSADDTLKVMQSFLEKNKKVLDISVISMPNSLLGECREMGLKKTKHQWHLRWDADMVFKTSGKEIHSELRKKVMSCLKPIAFQLPRTNLFGDFRHTSKVHDVVDSGEPILIRFAKNIKYVEHGRFDIIKLPHYYRIIKEQKRYYHHFDGVKPDLRLMYRNCYFDWREKYNSTTDIDFRNSLEDFDVFKKEWQMERYQTNDTRSLKYRFQKEYLLQLKQYDVNIYGDYPEIIRDLIYSDEARFEIEYINNKSIRRIDKMDQEMLNYTPTQDDLTYDPLIYLKKVMSSKDYKKIVE